jgi:hypothetical protein
MMSQQDMLRFLGSISRTELRQTDLDYILHFLTKDVPWEHLLMRTEADGVAGLLFHHLKHRGLISQLPKSGLRGLEYTCHRITQETLAVVAKAIALSDLLTQAQIPVIALQGLSVVKLYGDPGLRPMLDADLMVRPGDKESLKELLLKAGYRMPRPLYPDLLSKDGVLLDIHTHVLDLDRIENRRHLFPEDLTTMWERATRCFDQHDYLLILDLFDNIVALAAHALKHSYSRLIWLVDLHELLLRATNNSDGWERVVERARLWKQERILLYALMLVERIFDLKVPTWVKSNLGIERLKILEKYIIRLRLKGFISNEVCMVLWLHNIRGMGNRLKFVTETVFPRHEIMSQIVLRGSGKVKRLDHARRVVHTIKLLGKNLRRALRIYFKELRL